MKSNKIQYKCANIKASWYTDNHTKIIAQCLQKFKNDLLSCKCYKTVNTNFYLVIIQIQLHLGNIFHKLFSQIFKPSEEF